MMAPAHPRHLLGSAWTRVPADWRHHHWTVVDRHDADVIVRAVLDPGCERRLPWRTLRDRGCWLPGWQTCPPPAEADADPTTAPVAGRSPLGGADDDGEPSANVTARTIVARGRRA